MLNRMILTLMAPDSIPVCFGDVASAEEAKEIAADFSATVGAKYGYSIGSYIDNKYQELERHHHGEREHDANL